MPAVFGSLEDADKLFEAVKTSGLKYMMFETSYFHEDLYAMRQIYKAGGLGKLRLFRRRVLPLHGRRRLTPTRAGASACRRSGIRRTPTPTTSA